MLIQRLLLQEACPDHPRPQEQALTPPPSPAGSIPPRRHWLCACWLPPQVLSRPGQALSYPSHVLASNTGRARPRPADRTRHGLAGHHLHAQPYHRLWEQVGTDPPAGGSEEPESQAGRLSISSQPPAKGPEREDIINPVPTLPLPAAGTESSSAPSPGPNVAASTASGVRHGHGPRTGRHARSPTGRGRGKDCSGCAHC